MRFLEAKPEFPKSRQTGEVRLTTVPELLARPTYAGYVEAPNWGISLLKGFHEPLIDLATHERIQARLRWLRSASISTRISRCAALFSAMIATSP